MSDVLSYPFMQRALVAAVLVGVVCSVIGTYVVLKKLAFIGAGISHSAFGGVALGYLVGLDPIGIAIPFCLATAMAIGWVSRKGRVSEDTAIGIAFASTMALGALFIGLKEGYNVDLFGYLFGSILAVSQSDIWLILGLGVGDHRGRPAPFQGTAVRELRRGDGGSQRPAGAGAVLPAAGPDGADGGHLHQDRGHHPGGGAAGHPRSGGFPVDAQLREDDGAVRAHWGGVRGGGASSLLLVGLAVRSYHCADCGGDILRVLRLLAEAAAAFVTQQGAQLVSAGLAHQK